MTIRFGTDGVRGPAGKHPITLEAAVQIGRAAARLAQKHGGCAVLIGRDTRPSGAAFAAGIEAGVLAAGCDAMNAGVASTPALGVSLLARVVEVAVSVTASHNAVQDNGFKVIGPLGRKLDASGIAEFEGWLAEASSADRFGGQAHDVHDETWKLWGQAVQQGTRGASSLAGQKIAVDLANGAAIRAVDWLFENIPADWVVIGGGGVVNDAVGSEHPEALSRAVLEHGCAAGLAVDGDADRVLLVDEQGQAVSGDALTWLLARARSDTDIAVTVMSNGALERGLPGVQVRRTPVGDRHLREALDLHGLGMGAEESGHVLFQEHPVGDGLYTGLVALQALFSGHDRVSDAFRDFALLPRQTSKLRVDRRPPLEQVEVLEQARVAGEMKLGEHGRVFLRYSGTEPVLRLLVEGQDATAVASVMDAMRTTAGAALT